MSTEALERTVVAWNRSGFDRESDEMLAQILDRGDLAAWRELFALARDDRDLRQRILSVVGRVPLPYAGFWLAALAHLGEPIDWTHPRPVDHGIA
jgi:hypothetical protein